MKKIILISLSILLCVAFSGTMDMYLNAKHRINPEKKYFGGIDQDEMTLKALYVKGAIAKPANGTNYIGTAMNMSSLSTYTISANKVFVPMNLRITKSGVTKDAVTEVILMSKCLKITNLVSTNQQYTTKATNHVTNYMGEYAIPEGNALYEFGYPIMYSNYFIEYSQVLVRIENTSSLTCTISVQLAGFEIDE